MNYSWPTLIYAYSRNKIHSGDWLLGDGVLKEQGCCFCDCSLEEKEKIIQTRVETCCFT